ncbi:hypothetical protein TVAG_358220 [Trichomonas vaginalis G3]|uniref:Uncharacterized protein n=1 Tax=Trichomonas vaginalis (strain ATCC PRA-98 / G3) TaxID=412133 RepID=A2ELD0_TRIV3|nr:spectrin binding [Trichomonas vaginalis G3]EAY06532.1 hypothetical protein TVAG_358220 [Trichomonas vaginalis G3]KAI5526101.1 spectrin binding [Trichomonas vaginalis G3]|eukprot:XP_001318755.1 hypothetical protein [Trichomonas vaginalis G3]
MNDYFLATFKKELQAEIQIQSLISQIFQIPADSIINSFINQGLLDSNFLPTIIKNLVLNYLLNPHRITKYTDLIIGIHQLIPELDDVLRHSLMEELTSKAKRYQYEISYLIRILFQQQILNSSSISYICQVIQDPCEFFNILSVMLQDLLSESDNSILQPHLFGKLPFNNDLISAIDYCKYGGTNKTIIKNIIDDDLDSFIKILTLENIWLLETITVKDIFWDRNFFSYDVNLSDIAANFGSIKIFKYLMIKNSANRGDNSAEYAIIGQSLEIFKYFSSSFEDSCILIAAKYRNTTILNWILENQEINNPKINSDLLDLACKFNLVELCSHLKLSSHNFYDNSLILHKICKYGNYAILSFFTEFDNLLFNKPDYPDRNTPLHYAVISGSIKCVQFLLSFPLVEINAVNADNLTPYEIALKTGQIDIVYLISQLPELDRVHKSKEMSHLALAMQGGNYECIKYVWEMGLYSKDDYYSTVYTIEAFACALGNLDIVKLFYQEENDFKRILSNNMTAIHIAAANGKPNLVKWMIEEMKVNPNIVDSKKRTALHVAIENQQYQVAEYLALESGMDINSRDRLGKTPLLTAVWINDPKSVEIVLMNINADPTIPDFYDSTPLSKAQSQTITNLIQNAINDFKK